MASSSERSRNTKTMACSLALLDDDLHRGVLQEEAEFRRGPWTVDEDLTLVNFIADHGEGRWNSLARTAGLKRTGKSCRLRWLNYLRPDVKRGNLTADEQLLILDLHSRWGNRWSKIAQHLPGRTDNEIKNYWRTRVQKHAKQLNCDANSSRFKDAMRYLWMPRLVDQRLQHAAGVGGHGHGHGDTAADAHAVSGWASMGYMESSSMVTPSSSESFASESYDGDLYASVRAGEMLNAGDWMQEAANQGLWSESAQDNNSQFQDPELTGWVQGFSENFWSLEDIWKVQ